MVLKQISFQNRKGLVLRGRIHVPLRYSTAIIFLHGFPSSYKGFTSSRMIRAMQDKPYLFFTFSFSGSKGSQGKFEDKLMSVEVEDIYSAIDFLERKYGFQQLVLIGISTGAIDAALYAYQDRRVNKLVLLGGVSDLKHAVRYDFTDQQIHDFWSKGHIIYHAPGKWYDGQKLQKAFYEEFFTLDLPSAIKKYRRPLLIVHGEKDEAVPLFNALELSELARRPKKLAIIKNADHRFSKPAHFKKVLQLILHFIQK